MYIFRVNNFKFRFDVSRLKHFDFPILNFGFPTKIECAYEILFLWLRWLTISSYLLTHKSISILRSPRRQYILFVEIARLIRFIYVFFYAIHYFKLYLNRKTWRTFVNTTCSGIFISFCKKYIYIIIVDNNELKLYDISKLFVY